MAAELVMAPEAEQDLDEAYTWYEKQRVGLGEDFLTNVDACIETICRFPKIGKGVHQDFRRALVRRFPYSVFYEHDSNSRSCILAAKYWTNVTVLRKPNGRNQFLFSTPQHGCCHDKLTDDAQASLG